MGILAKTIEYTKANRCLQWNYRFEYDKYHGELTESKNIVLRLWFVGIQWDFNDPQWFWYDETYVDGHTQESVTLFKITFFKGYTYFWEDLNE